MRKITSMLVGLVLALTVLAAPAMAGKFQRGKVNINNDVAAGPQRGKVNISGSQAANHQVTIQRHGLLGRPKNIIVNSGNGVAGAALVAPAAISAGHVYSSYNSTVANQLLAPQAVLSTNRLNSFTVNPYLTTSNLTLTSPGAAFLTAPLSVVQAPAVQQYTYQTTTTAAPLVAAPVVQQYAVTQTAPAAVVTHSDTTTTCTTSTGQAAVGNVNYLTAPAAVTAPQADGCYHNNPAALLQNRQFQKNCTPAQTGP